MMKNGKYMEYSEREGWDPSKGISQQGPAQPTSEGSAGSEYYGPGTPSGGKKMAGHSGGYKMASHSGGKNMSGYRGESHNPGSHGGMKY